MPRPAVEAERKQQMLQATCAALADGGFRSLTIAEVAARAGTSGGAVHYYFATKDQLLRDAFEYNFATSEAKRRRIVESSASAVVRLRRLVESYVPDSPDTVQAWRVWVELWVSALDDAALRRINDTAYGEWRATVAALIRDGQQTGELRSGDATALANGLVAMVDGLAIQVLLGSAHMDARRMRAVCRSHLRALQGEIA